MQDQTTMDLVETYNDKDTIDSCINELRCVCFIPHSMKSNLRVAVILAEEHPEIIECDLFAEVCQFLNTMLFLISWRRHPLLYARYQPRAGFSLLMPKTKQHDTKA